MLDHRDLRKVGEEGGDDGDNYQAGEHHTQGGNGPPQVAPVFLPDEGGGVDGDDAGGALADGKVVGELLLGGPALLLHHLPLEDGEHGIASAEGAHAHLGKGQKQIEIEIQWYDILFHGVRIPRFRICCFQIGGFRRLRAASSFAHGGKGTKTPPGTRPMDYGSTLFRLGP